MLTSPSPDTLQVHRHPELSLADEARLLRQDILTTLYDTGGGHYGGSLSVIDLLLTLYRRVLRIDPATARHPERDRLILSKGHAAVALYAVLRRLGYFDWPLSGYASFASALEGHPDMTSVPGVDFSTGSLGQGLSVGIGMALALRKSGQHIWVVLGDGECQEGQVWEAAMLAAISRLDRLHVIVDCNRHQEWGWTSPDGSRPPPLPGIADKWRAFGWQVFECDGHDYAALETTLQAASAERAQPSVIIAHTVKGKGLPLIERDPIRFHCDAVSADEHAELLGSVDLGFSERVSPGNGQEQGAEHTA
ncbi:transketolase [Parachitinimonas caeni]|uniref:Transketolase n=1 Tax=Parachitinimonas caeni TaxID=3031301 RepID=A0ABT7DRM7_9NEIS|nr:transketolase [Parachitinimonas caeni]MDK2122716.1 transketolase [Parachitinimonas caeni]